MLHVLFAVGLYVVTIGRSNGALQLPEPAFYKELSELAAKQHIDLYVFSPDEYQDGELFGYRYRDHKWIREKVPLPDIVYDRCYYTEAGQRKACKAVLQALRARKPHRLLSSGSLPSKWEVHSLLSAYPQIAGLLPPTVKFRTAEQLLAASKRHPEGLFLKPAAGMQGKGTLLLRRFKDTDKITVDGRTRTNRPFSILFNDQTQWKKWLDGFIRQTPYIAQPYLNLSLPDGKPFDIRVLLQKDNAGEFMITGKAARIGKQGSITSNLHGGGTARNAKELLDETYGAKISGEIAAQMDDISEYIADRLEKRYGRFAELGFDFGIAADGKLWLLEVNSKPGRSAFGQLNDTFAASASIERPLLYAKLLNSREAPSFITRPSADGRRLNAASVPFLQSRRPSAR